MSLDASYHKEQDSICFAVGTLEILGLLYSMWCVPQKDLQSVSMNVSYNIIEPLQCGMCDQESLISSCAYSESDQSLY